MKLGTYEQEGKWFAGVIENDGIFPVDQLLEGSPNAARIKDMLEIIEFGEEALGWIREGLENGRSRVRPIPPEQVNVLAPIVLPAKNVFCVGRNYIEHVHEGDRANGVAIGAPKKPIFFTKAPTSVIGDGDPIVYPDCTRKLDYECELAVVIGKQGKDIKEEDVYDYIFGYTIINDVTARDLQDEHGQWFKGKSLDTFCPTGPYIVTKDELEWPLNVSLELRVNGELRQSMVTADMIFHIPRIISELSKGMTLEAGDIIATGTGPGCGFGFEPPKFLNVGDVVEIKVEGIGVLQNPVR
ncbi:fumarylacetoacetate hydrolase family protein [Paenibacillus beijingensis]|uniref:Fumarylacetoacetase-like C-terminal domain-containing protein n=1 Tax=Paenibacillus beijingensis TaxID=1126833 RepID=A0A0D5NIW1_9BACL|nr:fumarylacetoacetate hydrolase family protein [Paenibacillus beijingensis]AJY75191.1 hypothetical protein VN24_12140 [Paenibacillus beijingensis]